MPGRQSCRPGAALVLAAVATLVAGCGGDKVGEQPGPGSSARPVSECPSRFDGSFELVGRFPVKEPRASFAITGDRVASVEPDGQSFDIRLVGLAGSSDPDLDLLLQDDVRAVPARAPGSAPVHVAPALDGLVTAHGADDGVVVTRFDRAGFPRWETTVAAADTAGGLEDLVLVESRVYLRYSDTSAYPGVHAAVELDDGSGDRGAYVEDSEALVVESRLDLHVDDPAYGGFGHAGGPSAAVPSEARSLPPGGGAEPGQATVQCGDVRYGTSELDLWVEGGTDPVSLAGVVPDLDRRVANGDGAIMGVTPDAVWVGWRDRESGEGEMFALRYGS